MALHRIAGVSQNDFFSGYYDSAGYPRSPESSSRRRECDCCLVEYDCGPYIGRCWRAASGMEPCAAPNSRSERLLSYAFDSDINITRLGVRHAPVYSRLGEYRNTGRLMFGTLLNAVFDDHVRWQPAKLPYSGRWVLLRWLGLDSLLWPISIALHRTMQLSTYRLVFAVPSPMGQGLQLFALLFSPCNTPVTVTETRSLAIDSIEPQVSSDTDIRDAQAILHMIEVLYLDYVAHQQLKLIIRDSGEPSFCYHDSEDVDHTPPCQQAELEFCPPTRGVETPSTNLASITPVENKYSPLTPPRE